VNLIVDDHGLRAAVPPGQEAPGSAREILHVVLWRIFTRAIVGWVGDGAVRAAFLAGLLFEP
jgi:hypothetical protein